MVTWTRGRHLVKTGIGIPHIDRRAFDDNTNSLGTYTFGPTLASDGTVLQTALQNYANNLPSGFSQNTGDVHFIYHQQEMGAFIQDQFKVNDRFSITPGTALRLAEFSGHAAARLCAAPLLRLGARPGLQRPSCAAAAASTTTASARARCSTWRAMRMRDGGRSRFSLNPAQLPATGCVPITNCATLTEQPPNLARAGSQRQNSLSDSVWPLHRAATGRARHRHRQRVLGARDRQLPLCRCERAHPGVRLHGAARSGLRSRAPDAAGGLLGGQRAGYFLPRPPQQILHRLRALYVVALRVEHRRPGVVSAEPVRPQRRVGQRELGSPQPPRPVRDGEPRQHLQPRRGHLCQHRHAPGRC